MKKASYLCALAISAALIFVGTGCDKDGVAADNETSTPVVSNVAMEKPIVVIETSKGTMELELWADVAPKTVANFVKLANEKFYDGTAFHRVVDGFMIQGGCPNTKVGAKGIPGTGDPGYKIDAEFNNNKHVRGVISMARSQDPNSAGCQFFICLGDATFLDRQYTCFGKLINGDDVLGTIGKVPVVNQPYGGEKSQPTERIEIKSIRVK